MLFQDVVQTTKKTAWKNTKQYIIVHHTGSDSYTGNLRYLSTDKNTASVHYVVGQAWEVGKIWEHNDILWHAWVSERKWLVGMNSYSIGIEVCSDWHVFSDTQKKKVKELIQYIMKEEWIPKENVLRHVDIAPNRKRDVWPLFWNTEYQSWQAYQNSLVSNTPKMNINNVIQAVISLNSFLRDNIENAELRELLSKTNTILRGMIK